MTTPQFTPTPAGTAIDLNRVDVIPMSTGTAHAAWRARFTSPRGVGFITVRDGRSAAGR